MYFMGTESSTPNTHLDGSWITAGSPPATPLLPLRYARELTDASYVPSVAVPPVPATVPPALGSAHGERETFLALASSPAFAFYL